MSKRYIRRDDPHFEVKLRGWNVSRETIEKVMAPSSAVTRISIDLPFASIFRDPLEPEPVDDIAIIR